MAAEVADNQGGNHMHNTMIILLALALCFTAALIPVNEKTEIVSQPVITYLEPVQAEEQLPAYVLHVTDQDGNPVSGVYVNFCTDSACVMQKSDEKGMIIFDGEPGVYHLQLLKVPEGYYFDKDYEIYTEAVYSTAILHIRKD